MALALVALALALNVPTAKADHPYRPETPWYGARSIQYDWFIGATRGAWNARFITVIDWYCGFGCPGVPGDIKNSPFYPSQAWNQSDNLHTWVVRDTAHRDDNDTRIFILYHDGHWPTATHIHLYRLDPNGQLKEDNTLQDGPAVHGEIHVRQATIDSGTNSAATVISHEVGHAMGLADVTHSGTIMRSPDPGTTLPSSGDRRTTEWCIPFYFYWPC